MEKSCPENRARFLGFALRDFARNDKLSPNLYHPKHLKSNIYFTMDFTLKNNAVIIDSEKKEISLSPEAVILDTLLIEFPGEYEKSSILMYSFARNDEQLYHFRTEGYWIAYIPTLLSDISPEGLDFLGSIDILVMPGAKSMQPVVEKVEPRLLVTYGDTAQEIGHVLGLADTTPLAKYRLKETDLSSEKTGCVILG
jgi:hypothetical protein